MVKFTNESTGNPLFIYDVLTLPRRAQLLMRDGQSLVALVENSATTFTDLKNAAVSRC